MGRQGVTILTGAASGIGQAAALALARKSHRLALVDVNADLLAGVTADCLRHSPQSASFVCDVSDGSAVERTCLQIRAQSGPASVLINCAGIARHAPFLELAPGEWEHLFQVNVLGAVHFTRAVLPEMIAAREGLIINIGSRMAVDPHPNTTAYAASKAAILAFSKSLALEVKPHGVKVSLLAPGGTKTRMDTPKHEGYLDPSAIADAIVYITENTGKAWVRDLVVLPLDF
jgi:2,3-dihydro-2,3-dihydroxybenzoate dehydrogenase